MKAQWQRWSALFAARSAREKWILGLAALAVVYALCDVLWLTPSYNRWQTAQKTLAQKTADVAQVTAQANQLAEQIRAQEAQTRAALDAGRRDLGALSGELAALEKTLVPARRMTEFLQGLLPGRGLEVVGLKTLAPTPLVTPPPAGAKAAGATTAGEGEKVAATSNLYKHGVEITLAGSFPALLDYLERLEQAPQKVLFGRLELRVDKYPRSELTLTLYTLSLDRSWLIV